MLKAFRYLRKLQLRTSDTELSGHLGWVDRVGFLTLKSRRVHSPQRLGRCAQRWKLPQLRGTSLYHYLHLPRFFVLYTPPLPLVTAGLQRDVMFQWSSWQDEMLAVNVSPNCWCVRISTCHWSRTISTFPQYVSYDVYITCLWPDFRPRGLWCSYGRERVAKPKPQLNNL